MNVNRISNMIYAVFPFTSVEVKRCQFMDAVEINVVWFAKGKKNHFYQRIAYGYSAEENPEQLITYLCSLICEQVSSSLYKETKDAPTTSVK